MTIGEFAERTRLSPKALRLYEKMGLLEPTYVESSSGYRYYSEDQIDSARLVGMLRRLDMPLSIITRILAAPQGMQADAVSAYWADVERQSVERRSLVVYLQAKLNGEDMPEVDVRIRHIPERKVAAISRHLYAKDTDRFFANSFLHLRAAGPGLEGIEGCPFLIFYGDVSEDSDGPLELCRPVRDVTAPLQESVQVRVEPAHDEVYVGLTKAQMNWPSMAPAMDAMEMWIRHEGRVSTGPVRQVMFEDQRRAQRDAPVCDLSVPLKSLC
jgi:DNA-binding transcriptional MerR regulator